MSAVWGSVLYGAASQANGSAPQNMDPQSFYLFSEFPTEIRLQIFSIAILEPSIITFNNSRFTYPKPDDEPWGRCVENIHIFVTHRPIPSLLHVNTESRAVCLSYLTLGFDVSIARWRSSVMNPCAVNGHYEESFAEKHGRRLCRHEEDVSLSRTKHIYWNAGSDIVHIKLLPPTK